MSAPIPLRRPSQFHQSDSEQFAAFPSMRGGQVRVIALAHLHHFLAGEGARGRGSPPSPQPHLSERIRKKRIRNGR
jgi:hypothetical protein